MKFGAISWKIKLYSNNSLIKVGIWNLLHTCYSHNCDYLPYSKVSFYQIDFLVRYRFPFPILRFLRPNHQALLKDRFLKKMLLKRANTRRLFLAKLQAQIFLLQNIDDIQLTSKPSIECLLLVLVDCPQVDMSVLVHQALSVPQLGLVYKKWAKEF